jgi:hypothetical protein
MDSQEVIDYMVTEMNRNKSLYSDACELADKAADMFDLWEEREMGIVDSDEVMHYTEYPEWVYEAAEDIFFGNY